MMVSLRQFAQLSGALLVTSVLLLTQFACRPDRLAPQPNAPSASTPSFEILDGSHAGGNPHFFFLPPMVPAPSYSGTTDPSQLPVVIVCDWVTTGSSSACGTIVAFFSMSAGAGSEVERYDPSSQAYIVNWHTDQCLTGACTLDPTKTYRLRVLAGPLELGHADVTVVSGGSELKNIQVGQDIGLVEGRTLPVRFRIEQGAVAVVTPGSPTSIGPNGGNIVTTDGNVALAVPPGALAAPTNLTVATATAFPTGAGPWSVPVDLGPTGTTFATPVTLTLSYDPTQLPAGVPPNALSVYVSDGTGWELVPGGTVDAADNTVSVPISHFSTYALTIAPTVVNGVPSPTTIAIGQSTTLTGYAWGYQVVPAPICNYVYSGRFFPPRYVCITQLRTYTYPVANQAILWAALPTGTQVISLASIISYTDQTGAATSPPITGLSTGTAQIVASLFVASGFFGTLVQSNSVTITVPTCVPDSTIVGINEFTTAIAAGGFPVGGLIRGLSAGLYRGTPVIFAGGPIYGTSTADAVVAYAPDSGTVDVVRTPVCLLETSPSYHTYTQLHIKAGLNAPAGLVVTEESFTFPPPNNGYVLFRYVFTDTASTPIANFWTGFALDWDLQFDNTALSDVVRYDASLDLGEVVERDSVTYPQIFGIVLIDSLGAGAVTSIQGWGGSVVTQDGLFNLLTTGGVGANLPIGPRDVRELAGRGPVTIPPGGHLVMYFAFVGGDDRNGFTLNVSSARAGANQIGFH